MILQNTGAMRIGNTKTGPLILSYHELPDTKQYYSSEAEFLDIIGTSFPLPSCYSQSHLRVLTDFTSQIPPPPPNKRGLKLVCNVNIAYGNLKF